MLEYGVRLQNDRWIVELDGAAVLHLCNDRAEALAHATRLALSAWMADRTPTTVTVYEDGAWKTIALFESLRQPESA